MIKYGTQPPFCQSMCLCTIGTININGPRAALQGQRRKCGSLTDRVGYRFLCTTSATLWSQAKPLKSALVQERVWHPAGTQPLWSRDAYVCVCVFVSKLEGGGIDSDNGLSVRCQIIIWTNAGWILTGPLGTYLGEIVIKAIFIQDKALKTSAKRKPFYPGLNVLIIKM